MTHITELHPIYLNFRGIQIKSLLNNWLSKESLNQDLERQSTSLSNDVDFISILIITTNEWDWVRLDVIRLIML